MGALRFLKDWALILSMLTGVTTYFIYSNIPALRHAIPNAYQIITWLQPILIFCTLFLTFCKVNPRSIRLCRWHIWLLLIQCFLFVAISVCLMAFPFARSFDNRVILEGAMICLICPTATAAPVITRKLGGNISQVTTYTILINIAAGILIPVMLPYIHPQPGLSTLNATFMILGKVFPLLLVPLVLAWIFRFVSPRLNDKLTQWQEIPFYIWVVSLALAIAVTARSIAHSAVPIATQLWLVAASLLACVGQFWLGRRIGAKYDAKVTAGQSLGQKNTVLAIWLGYTFFTPVTSIAGGFYSIWHNVINTYQLYSYRKKQMPHFQHINPSKN